MFKKIRAFLHILHIDPRQVVTLVMLALLLTLMVAPAFAQSDTLVIDIDPTPLFDGIATYLPMFFGVLAIGGSLLVAKKIAMFVITMIADAF